MKILLFSRDPGGTNTIIPLIKPLNARGHETDVYGKDFALKKYLEAGISATDIARVIPKFNLQNLRNFIHAISPQVVVTGTSADDHTEKYLWHVCSEENIPSLAIIDQWCNYGIRFSDYGVDKIQQYDLEKTHTWLPTRIATLDDFAKKEMIEQGIPEKIIDVCGQPYFEMLLNYINNKNNSEYRPNNDNFNIVFCSEPITATYGNNALHTKGYTELTIFKSLVAILDDLNTETEKQIKLIIRPHPKEDKYKLSACLDDYVNIKWKIDASTPSWELIDKADLVCGMSSMFLIEALIIGKPIMSIQIGLCTEDPFVLSRRGVIKSILTQESLKENLRKALTNNDDFKYPTFEIIPNPVELIIKVLEKLSCQNLQ